MQFAEALYSYFRKSYEADSVHPNRQKARTCCGPFASCRGLAFLAVLAGGFAFLAPLAFLVAVAVVGLLGAVYYSD